MPTTVFTDITIHATAVSDEIRVATLDNTNMTRTEIDDAWSDYENSVGLATLTLVDINTPCVFPGRHWLINQILSLLTVHTEWRNGNEFRVYTLTQP